MLSFLHRSLPAFATSEWPGSHSAVLAAIHRTQFFIASFVTGLCVLVIELSATRILSPYFGNTIFSFSGVITIVLAALSAGYYIGGQRADRDPSPRRFYSTIVVSGLSVVLLHLLSVVLLPLLGRLPIVWGPLLTAAVLFFMPAFFLGMLSPYAVKLQTASGGENTVGTVSGTIFFWSTLGSLAGSLLTGFVLIPLMGLQAILFTIAGLLFIVGIAGLALHRSLTLRHVALCAAGVVLAFVFARVRAEADRERYVFITDGVYERLAVLDTTNDGQTVRRFLQDRSVSGIIDRTSGRSAASYTTYLDLYRAFNPKPKTALIMGAGVYILPRQLAEAEPEATVHVAEVEPSLRQLAERYFHLSREQRIIDHLVDGRRLLRDSPRTYD
ncbi:MAG TPA: fused MFS/spermidine synthase, partial [Bryobacteraceae bacterium]|nr:fused MFS/spermidine synthase [Bryobacteraceae bacterium]